jgi:predicted DsbA family dithiol-disulfide isomerase
MPRREMYAAKFGPQRAKQIEAMMQQTSRDEGLDFKFGGMTGPSRNGHRLVRYAQTHGGEDAQNAVMHGLWKRYFEQEVDITTLETLVEVGVEAGVGSAEEVKTYLESGKDAKAVDGEADEARGKGISGVPHYEIQGLWEISGAQEPRAFEMLFKRYKEMEAKGDAPKAETSTGTACL